MTELRLQLDKLHANQEYMKRNRKKRSVERCGRRFGKTFQSIDWFTDDLMKGYPVAFLSPTYKMLADVWRDYKRIFAPIISAKNEQEKRIELITGGSIDFWSGESADSIRGRKYKKFFADEAAMVKELKDAWNNIISPTLMDYNGDIIFASTPRGLNDFKELDEMSKASEDWSSFHFTTYDNPYIKPEVIDELKLTMSPLAFQQEIMAEYIDNSELALWQYEQIDKLRVSAAPEGMTRVVIPIDPAVTANKNSDETGIIPCGMKDGHYYVLGDASGIYKPLQWATRAIEQYKIWHADLIVGEVNNGGDLVEANLRSVDRQIPYKAVRASRGKVTRAEPIASLYQQGLVHHVGYLRELETQMVTWSPQDDDSPDRIDALVWGLTELSTRKKVSVSFGASQKNWRDEKKEGNQWQKIRS